MDRVRERERERTQHKNVNASMVCFTVCSGRPLANIHMKSFHRMRLSWGVLPRIRGPCVWFTEKSSPYQYQCRAISRTHANILRWYRSVGTFTILYFFPLCGPSLWLSCLFNDVTASSTFFNFFSPVPHLQYRICSTMPTQGIYIFLPPFTNTA